VRRIRASLTASVRLVPALRFLVPDGAAGSTRESSSFVVAITVSAWVLERGDRRRSVLGSDIRAHFVPHRWLREVSGPGSAGFGRLGAGM
jgi:hypothetical protein